MLEIKNESNQGLRIVFESIGYRDPLVRTDLANVILKIEAASLIAGSVVEDSGSSKYVLNFPCSNNGSDPGRIKEIVFRSPEDSRSSLVIDTENGTDTLQRVDAVFTQVGWDGCPAIRFCSQIADNKVRYIDVVVREGGPVFSRRGVSEGDLFMVANDPPPGNC